MIPKYFPPSTFHLLLAGLGHQLNRSRTPIHPTPKIGPYSLVKEIHRTDSMPNYTFGIYRHGRKKVFIKTWHGGLRDFNYYFLRTEITLSQILKPYTTAQIRLPELIAVIPHPSGFSAIFEFLEGETLNHSSLNYQANAIHQVIRWLTQTSSRLTPVEKSYLPRLGLNSYLFQVPLMVLVQLIHQSQPALSLVRQTVTLIRSLLQFSGTSLVLSHRDLTPDNLQLHHRHLYLLDIESFAYTLPGYDHAFIFACNFSALSHRLAQKLGSSPDPRLLSYLSFRHPFLSTHFNHPHHRFLKTRLTLN